MNLTVYVCVRVLQKKTWMCGVCSVLLIHTYDRTRKKKEKKRSKLLNDDGEDDEKNLYSQSPLTD